MEDGPDSSSSEEGGDDDFDGAFGADAGDPDEEARDSDSAEDSAAEAEEAQQPLVAPRRMRAQRRAIQVD